MKWNNDIFKRYMEAGLAILIVLTLGLAGAAGVLSPRATEREQNETAAENDSTKASQENENKTSASNPDTEEAQEAIADGQYPIMGSSDVTVQEMVDYFNASGEEYPAEELSEGGADSIETFCQMYYDEAAAEGVTLDTATTWQKIDFGADIEGVTNVRVVALETAGQSANESNKYASAAELRVTRPVAPEKTEVDKTGLEESIAQIANLNKDSYTPETWAVLEEKLREAQAVMDDPDATQYDVALAIANLADAVTGLEAVTPPTPETPDKSGLENAVAEAGGLDQGSYTAESWQKYQEALANAQAVLADENAAQADIDAALQALNIAKAGLVKADGEGGQQGGQSDGKPQGGQNSDKKPSSSNGKDAARTGDASETAPVAGIMAAALAAIAVVLRKRK